MSIYGIIISLAILVSAIVVERNAKKANLDPNLIWDLVIIVVPSGIIGARLYHVVSEWSYYSHYPENIFKIWNGGLGIYGAILGGIIGLSVYLFFRKIKASPYIDLIAISLPLGQAIGRLGNFFNQEIYGKPTNLPWAIFVNPEHRFSGYANQALYHPLFAYEIVANLVIFFWLMVMFSKYSKQVGTYLFFWSYIAGYSAVRLYLEQFRIQSWWFHGINVVQAISLFLLLLAFYKRKKLGCNIKL